MNIHESIRAVGEKISIWINVGDRMSEGTAVFLGELSTLLILLIVSYIAFRLTIYLEKMIIIPLLKRSRNQFDDILLTHRFYRKVAYLVPTSILFYYLEDAVPHSELFINIALQGIEIVYVLIVTMIINSILRSLNDYYDRFSFAKDHPIKSLVQIFQMIMYFIAFLIIVALIFDKSVGSLVLGLGTVSAVLMLIFKDPILGFVGGMQLLFNKMLSIGDWITMPNFGADGEVLEINLTTVKIQNWDKTIVTIPTYSLISDSFQNWKGMRDSGGRRIKRSINIDMNSVRFCDEELMAKLKKIELIRDYLEEKEKEIKVYNKDNSIDPSVKVNGRRQTNLGIFRAYLEAYLHSREDVLESMTFMVRQLEPNEKGIPLEVYLFTNTTNWVTYEGIQSDIFDHILASVPEFELRIFQFPTDKSISIG